VADKFGRNYLLNVELENGETLTIGLPFTMEFDIVRKINSSANTSNIKIYNLAKDNRNQIRFNWNDRGLARAITLQAGYGNALSTMHFGQIQLAQSYRQGVDFITEITSFDGGFDFMNSRVDDNIPATQANPLPKKALFTNLVNRFKYIKVGTIGNYVGEYTRGQAQSRYTTDILKEEFGDGFFVDNGIANCLQDNEYIPTNEVPVINSQSGLLGTPILQQQILTFDMLFEPRLILGQIIELQSSTFQDSEGNDLDGFYKVNGIHHKGIISPVISGSATTSVEMYNVGSLLPA
jgi:hypothetical protein